jgi:RNA polymerase sigma factor (sigma-70 family)
MVARADLETIERVYRARAGDFFRYALARTGDPERARDAVQEGFARAIRSRSTFRAAGSVEAWIARCVINAANDRARDGQPSPAETDEPVTWQGDDSVVENVRRAVRRLPMRQREAVFLRHYLDFDYATIAAALDVEVGTVSATLHAAHRHLSQALELEVSP